jgi:two-component system, cell cycle response regulator
MQILVAEDDATSRTILTALLIKWDYDPVVVSDGQEAWEIMQKPGAPYIALLDWEMPGMDGLAVCRRIRERRDPNPPYVIILTAKDEKADIVKGLDAGANDYVSKPYDNDELLARIRVGQRMVELQAELLDARDALAHEAMHDPLTGAPNRRAILDRLSKELDRAGRRNSELSVGMCDIDHFKRINDTFGHQVGDEVLCGFVQEIRNTLRPYDLMGRYGGEEFLVLAPGCTGLVAEGLYERLRAKIDGLRIATRSGAVCITISIGVAGADGEKKVDALLAEADAALYTAKNNGRNRVVYCRHSSLEDSSA